MEVFSAEETSGFFGRMKAWISGGKSNLTDTEELPTAAITKVSDPASWKRYDYTQECGFSVQFPELPEHSGQVIEVPQSDLSIRYDTYVAETFSDNTVYVVSVWEYPEKVDISKPELNLQEGFAGMLYALPESQVLYLKATSMQGHKALEFWILYTNLFNFWNSSAYILLINNDQFSMVFLERAQMQRRLTYSVMKSPLHLL